MEDYKLRAMHYNNDKDKIIVAAPINISEGDYPNIYSNYLDEELYIKNISKKINDLYISAINIGAKYLFYYGGESHFNIENQKNGGYKSPDFYSKLTKSHLIDKINFINLIPGYTFDFEKVYGMFQEFNYSEQTLKNNSLKFYKK